MHETDLIYNQMKVKLREKLHGTDLIIEGEIARRRLIIYKIIGGISLIIVEGDILKEGEMLRKDRDLMIDLRGSSSANV